MSIIIHDKGEHIAFLNRTLVERDAEIKRLRAEIEWRKMRQGLVEVLLDAYGDNDTSEIDKATVAVLDFDVTHPKP